MKKDGIEDEENQGIPHMNTQGLPPEAVVQIPNYITHRLKDVETMVENLEYGNLDRVQEIAFRVKGNAQAYGFQELSRDAQKIEAASMAGREEEILTSLRDMKNHLEEMNEDWRSNIIH